MKKIIISLIYIISILSFQNIYSQSNTVLLKEVEVTASRNVRLLKNSPEIVRVINRTEIEQLNANNISEILDHVAGVNIETGTGSGFPKRSIASLNGFPAQYTLVLINGVRILSDHMHTGQNMSYVPVEEIERIEILKTASSAQYGSDAIAGVINIITKSSKKGSSATIYGDVGSYNTYRGGASVKTQLSEKTGIYNFIEWEESDGTPLLAPTHRIGKTGYSGMNISSRLTTQIGSKLKIDAWLKTISSSMQWQDSESKSNLFIPSLLMNYQISDHSAICAKVSYTSWFAETSAENNQLFRPEIFYQNQTGKNNRITAGTDFSLNNFTRSSVEKHVQRLIGIFLQDELIIKEKLLAEGSLRMDIVQTSEPVITPKLALLYKLSDPVNFRLSYSRGFHSPNVQELYEQGYGHGGTAYRFGNPDLKPEFSSTYALCVDFNIKNKIFITASGYYSDVTNMIIPVYQGQWDLDTNINVWMRENILKAQIITGEIGVRWFFSNNYSLNSSYNYSKNIMNSDYEQQLPYNPGQSLNLKLTGKQKISGKLTISEYVSLRAVHGRSAWDWKPNTSINDTNPKGLITELADYQKLDAGITIIYDNKYTAFLNINNILGQNIENLDDAFTMIDGEPVFRTGIKIKF
jgi:outer membrane receptor for ferrienterochelin and colicins